MPAEAARGLPAPTEAMLRDAVAFLPRLAAGLLVFLAFRVLAAPLHRAVAPAA